MEFVWYLIAALIFALAAYILIRHIVLGRKKGCGCAGCEHRQTCAKRSKR